jgi:hypothetical protein
MNRPQLSGSAYESGAASCQIESPQRNLNDKWREQIIDWSDPAEM